MKLTKSDLKIMADVIADYKNYILELDQDEGIEKMIDNVNKLDDKLYDILNKNK